MRIAEASISIHALPLAASPTGGRTAALLRRIALLHLRTDDGRSAFGECAPLPSHGTEDEAAAFAALHRACARLPGRPLAAADEVMPSGDDTPAARAALETARLDLAAQAAARPLWHHLADGDEGSDTARERQPAASAFAGALAALPPDAPGRIAHIARLARLAEAGFTVIKLKLGQAAPETELAALRTLCRALPPSVRLRLDANRAWDVPTAARMCAALAALPIEMLEEPLALPVTEAFDELAALQDDLPFPLALDEGWGELRPAARRALRERFLADPPVRRLVLKLAPAGGPAAALAAARTAAAAGIECVVTTGIDGACATLAAAHLAAVLDNGLAHGLATSGWLAADIGAPPRIVDGRLHLPPAAGLGFVPASVPASASA